MIICLLNYEKKSELTKHFNQKVLHLFKLTADTVFILLNAYENDPLKAYNLQCWFYNTLYLF